MTTLERSITVIYAALYIVCALVDFTARKITVSFSLLLLDYVIVRDIGYNVFKRITL